MDSMRNAKTFLFFGIWVAVLPYLGFPIMIKNILFSVTGVVLIYIGLLVRAKVPKSERRKKFDNFSESDWQNDQSVKKIQIEEVVITKEI